MPARKPKPAGYEQMRRKEALQQNVIAPLPTVKEWESSQTELKTMIIKVPGNVLQDTLVTLGVESLNRWAKEVEAVCKVGHRILLIPGADNIIRPNYITDSTNLTQDPDARDALSGAERYASSANARVLTAVLRGNGIGCRIFEGSEIEDLANLLDPLTEQWDNPKVVILAGAGHRAQEWTVEAANLFDQSEVFMLSQINNGETQTINITDLLKTPTHGGIDYDALQLALFDEITIRILPAAQKNILQSALADPTIGTTIAPR